MKKPMKLFLYTMLAIKLMVAGLLLAATPALADEPQTVTVIVNGEELLTDVPAQVINERTMVPFRALLEKLGATVYWTEGSDSFSAEKDGTLIEMTINDSRAYVNGTEYILDVPPTIIDDRTLIPVRFVSEALGYEVIWSDMDYTAYINDPASEPEPPSDEIRLINPVEKIKVGADFIIPNVAELDDGLANDPGYQSQWALSWTNANQLWGNVEQQRAITVAVVDTGVDYSHPDLQGRILSSQGYDFVNQDSDAMDDNGHGTHCAGVIAARTNNNEGVAGIAGELDVAILPVKVMDSDGSGSSEDIASGIVWAVDHNADIINLSIGARGDNQEIASAVQYAVANGVLVVAAAGNDSADADLYTPANSPGVCTVAATNPLNTKATFSNSGSCVEIAAPGVKILSTVPGGTYEAWSGTSMAAPVVSGIAAVLMASDSSLDAPQAMSIISAAAHDIGDSGYDERTGYGLIDALQAFTSMQ